MLPEDKNERDFLRVASFSTVLGFACMGLVLSSFNASREPAWQFSGWSLVWTVLSGLAGWLIWAGVRRYSNQQFQTRKRIPAYRVFGGVTILSAVIGLLGLLGEKWTPAAFGVSLACFGITFIFWLMQHLDPEEDER
jgi:uncharacterized membrane protein YphA (DoxX/SURF4 family)